MKKILLAIDVGNSSTSVGVFRESPYNKIPKAEFLWSCDTPVLFSPTHRRFLVSKIKRYRQQTAYILVSSVVPHINKKLKQFLSKTLSAPVHFVSSVTPSQIKIRVKNPHEVGADRLVDARASLYFHKGPSIIVDFGTATTFDCVSAKSEYLGGVIAPGPVISAQALYERTAKLPYVHLGAPARILGSNTRESVESGLYHGYRGLVKEILIQLKKKMGPKTKVFATGGQAKWLLKDVQLINQFVPEMTLVGLYFLWRDSAQEIVK